MCKGANWVPLDAFHSRDTASYEKALELARDIGCNIMRCWGGNVYEDHEFFDFCDRNGIMIWQDFAMACRIYHETERFKKLIFDEATAVVRKLRNHPSIVLWSGDNEIDKNIKNFTDPSCNSLAREVLPKAIRLNDIGSPYLASSPYFSSAAYAGKDRGVTPSELHLWGSLDYFKSDFYKNSKAHFISRSGIPAAPPLN